MENSIEVAARAWIAAWNARDLDAIMEHYAEDVVFRAASVVTRWGRSDGRLHGKAELRRHFERALEAAPNLRFDFEAVLGGPAGYAILFERDGYHVVDTLVLDAAGRAIEACVYQDPRTNRSDRPIG